MTAESGPGTTDAPRGRLSLPEALLPLATMVVAFAAGALAFGPSQELLVAALLAAAAVAGASAVRHGAAWADIQQATGRRLAEVLPALLILLAIGALIATWMLAGTIPFLVYWGVRLVRPELLVPTAFLATAMMSLFTGTSWGSAGTVGVALVSTAAALGAPVAATAGAVVSGAYVGDKISPLSDTTNICALAAGVPLYRHMRHLLWTTAPSFVVALTVYALSTRITGNAQGAASASGVLGDIERVYSLNAVVLLPLAVAVVAIARRTPPALAIMMSAVVAMVVGILVQGFTVESAVLAAIAGFRTEMIVAAGIDAGPFGDAFLRLAERGGLYSMATTLVVILAAFLLAGAMEAAGALDLIIRRMLGAVRSVFGLIAATLGAGLTMVGVTSHAGVTALVVGGLFRDAYASRGLAPENLSRSLEDSATITEALMPWTVSAVFMAGTLGVPTLAYAPWAVFNYTGPLFSLLIAALYPRTGLGLRLLPAVARPIEPASAGR